MYELKSRLGPAFRLFFTICIFHLQKSMNASAIFALLAHLSLSAPLLYYPPAKINECFGSNHTSGRLGAFNLFGGVRPLNNCVLVSKRHVFYELFEATLGLREKHVFYGPFEALRGVRKWREPARGNDFRRHIGRFFDAKERQNIVSSIYRGPIFTIKYNGFPTSSRKSRIASLNP